MRVAGGVVRGHRLKGAVTPGVRPTSERARAAIFNVIPPWVLENARVLDLFAGTGSLGIEALSRGAAWADFVERNRRQCQVLRANLEATGFRRAGPSARCADAASESCGNLPGPLPGSADGPALQDGNGWTSLSAIPAETRWAWSMNVEWW